MLEFILWFWLVGMIIVLGFMVWYGREHIYVMDIELWESVFIMVIILASWLCIGLYFASDYIVDDEIGRDSWY